MAKVFIDGKPVARFHDFDLPCATGHTETPDHKWSMRRVSGRYVLQIDDTFVDPRAITHDGSCDPTPNDIALYLIGLTE